MSFYDRSNLLHDLEGFLWNWRLIARWKIASQKSTARNITQHTCRCEGGCSFPTEAIFYTIWKVSYGIVGYLPDGRLLRRKTLLAMTYELCVVARENALLRPKQSFNGYENLAWIRISPAE
jgi:hypothetical protein